MLSVCIPVFNNPVGSLVKALYFQKTRLKYLVEIIVIDDASEMDFKMENRELGKYVDKYIELDENTGRSGIRNLFLKYVTKPNVLFIDSDSVIDNLDFLQTYIETIKKKNGSVIVGGNAYAEKKPEKNKILRWKYGREVESKPAAVRNEDPYKSFISKNFVIPRETLKKIPFEESLTGYGHEDTLMGYRLKKEGVEVFHIDNYVVNNELDTNEEYLEKSREAVKSLFVILDIVKGDPDFIGDVKLLVWVRKMYQMKLFNTVKGVLNILNPFIVFALKNGLPSIFLFNLFKLYHALNICSASGAGKYFRN